MDFSNEQLMALFLAFIDKLHQSTPAAPPKPIVPPTTDPLGPDKVGADGMATPPEARGNPPEPVGWQWMRGQAPSGFWAEKWVYVGVQHATGAGIQPGESVLQYAQRMGVPPAQWAACTSAEAVDGLVRHGAGPA